MSEELLMYLQVWVDHVHSLLFKTAQLACMWVLHDVVTCCLCMLQCTNIQSKINSERPILIKGYYLRTTPLTQPYSK